MPVILSSIIFLLGGAWAVVQYKVRLYHAVHDEYTAVQRLELFDAGALIACDMVRTQTALGRARVVTHFGDYECGVRIEHRSGLGICAMITISMDAHDLGTKEYVLIQKSDRFCGIPMSHF